MVLEQKSEFEMKMIQVVEPKIHEVGLKLYDLTWNSRSATMVIYIFDEKTDTANLDDCIKVDRALSQTFEESDFIPENVTLEVSSPGIYRHLSTIEHFQKAIGQTVLFQLNKKIDEVLYPDFPKALRNNLKIKAKLCDATDTGVAIDLKELKIDIPYNQIKKANIDQESN